MAKPIYLGLILEETPWTVVLTPKQPESPPRASEATKDKPKKSE